VSGIEPLELGDLKGVLHRVKSSFLTRTPTQTLRGEGSGRIKERGSLRRFSVPER
jgi:hypothetical protein